MSDDPEPIDAENALDRLRPPDNATDAERLDVAIELHLASAPWTQIAAQCGYATPESARVTVTQAMQRAALAMTRDFRQAAIVRQWLRLEEWNRQVYPLTMLGNLDAIKVSLSIHDRVVKLLRLDEGEQTVGARDIVVPRKEDLADELRRAVLEREGIEDPPE